VSMESSKLFEVGKRYASKPILIGQDGIQFYANNFESLEKFLEENIERFTITFLICENTLPVVATLIGLLENKNAVFLVNRETRFEKLNELVENYEPDYIMASVDWNLTVTLFEIQNQYDGMILYSKKATTHPIKENYGKLFLSTSGSTGSSKYVALSEMNIQSNAKSISKYLELSESDTAVTNLPISYSYGFSVLSSHLISGASIAVTNLTLFDRRFWDFFASSFCTSLSGVPFTYEMLKKLKFDPTRYPNLRFITQAGGRLSDDLMKEFSFLSSESGKKFFVMYGQTEATARISYVPPENLPQKIGSIGIPIPGGSLRLVSELGSTITQSGEIGELVYEGPNVSLGYVSSRKDLAYLKPRLELETGDLAYRDQDGYYYLVGRKKRFIKIFGNRINLDEVEKELLITHPNVCCSGSDEGLNIYFTDNTNQSELEEQVQLISKIPRSLINILQIKEIPRLDNGKINYHKLKDLKHD